MTGSKSLLVASMMSALFLSACAEPGTYPISGEKASPEDPVIQQYNPSVIFRGESR